MITKPTSYFCTDLISDYIYINIYIYIYMKGCGATSHLLYWIWALFKKAFDAQKHWESQHSMTDFQYTSTVTQ